MVAAATGTTIGLLALVSLTEKISSCSLVVSPKTDILIVAVACPGTKLTVPLRVT